MIGPAGDLPVTDPAVVAIANDYLPPWVAWLLAATGVLAVGLADCWGAGVATLRP